MSNKEIEFTGERFVPGKCETKLEVEHMQRYMAVLPYIQGKTVLDAACGEGYGSNMMASVAAHVTGIDIDDLTIEHAREKYADQTNLKFLQGSIADLRMIDSTSVDVVVSFETIEHVPEDIQALFLKEIKRILKPDGILFMSTPNKKIYSDLYHYKNEYHIHEFNYDEFSAFIHSAFQNVIFFNQSYEVLSSIAELGKDKTESVYMSRNILSGDSAKYFVVAASDGSLNDINFSSVIAYDDKEYDEMLQRIVQLQNEVEERNSHMFELDHQITEKNQHIKILLDEKDSLQQEHIHILKDLIDSKQQFIDTQSQLSGIQHELNETKQELELLNGTINNLKQTILNKEGHIELLLEVKREYEREKQTTGYRVVKKIGKTVDFTFPPHSKRRFFAYNIKNLFCHPVTTMKLMTPKNIKDFFYYLGKDDFKNIEARYEELKAQAANGGKPSVPGVIKVNEINKNISIEEQLKLYDPISVPHYENPLVSIVIPVYNKFEYTYNCIKSIIENSGDCSYEILIADDCSTDVTGRVTEIISNIRHIKPEKNCRFLLNCNNAAKYARGDYILFLNNDTQVQKDWLQPLIDLIQCNETIGMVGSRLIYPDGRLQEAGGILWKDGSAWNYGNGQDPELPEFNYVKDVDYISGAAIMIRKSLWNEIGGFDERYIPAYCEDSDLAFEVRAHGYRVVYQPKSVVVHFEGISNGTDVAAGLKAYQVENSKKFCEKWKDVLEKEHFPNAENVFTARDRSRNKPCLLMIDHYVPMYDKDAGSRTLYQYLKQFADHGYSIKFIGDNYYRHEPYTTDLQQMGIEVLYGPYYYQNWENWIKENAGYFEYVWLNRPHISIKYIDILRQKTNARLVYYNLDLHFLRVQREYELSGNKELETEVQEWKEKEFHIMKNVDMNYTLSTVEKDIINDIDPDIPIKVMGIFSFETFPTVDIDSFSDRKGMLFVGGFTHTPNVDAVEWLTREIAPKLAEFVEAPIYIVGSNPPEWLTQLDQPNIIVKGYVTDQELSDLYNKCRLAIIPLRYGAGVKGKVIEAMYNGLPVITTDVGAEGVPEIDKVVEICNTSESIVEMVARAYSDISYLKERSILGQNYVKGHFSSETTWNIIKEDFS